MYYLQCNASILIKTPVKDCRSKREERHSGSWVRYMAVTYRGGLWFKPLPEIPKALQNRTKLNTIVKTVKKLLNLGRQHLKMLEKWQ